MGRFKANGNFHSVIDFSLPYTALFEDVSGETFESQKSTSEFLFAADGSLKVTCGTFFSDR